ncbi:hypothetical protein QEJ31_06140 [Pigmentibacter sp. JX0631]|uniref:hypothetical protein n=1 Tax=Pigmentibacter sp. JX0631 TaxID=2976982 RepID=UPI0024698DED|nr:hypothetical protein [Pigmentibacter sp. JX0631]WGL61175.1 hypothetical protein QEJ31_06140 [Pigmentibacter sp. JX0631]
MARLHHWSLILILLHTSGICYGINILSWWGYLTENELKVIEAKCSTKIYFDEYYSNDEFLRRVRKDDYSIIIFSSVVYNFVSDLVKNQSVSLSKSRSEYNYYLLKEFKKKNFPQNIGIFSVSYTGFLYDQNNFNLDTNDEIEDIFRKAEGKVISILDDHIESLNLLQNLNTKKEINSVVNSFSNLLNNKTVFITNYNDKIVKNKNFAFSFTWMGEALYRIKKYNDYKFYIHPKMNYLSVDLISAIKNDNKTKCVIDTLLNKDFLNNILASNFYISPYSDLLKLNIKNSGLDWIKIPDKNEYNLKSNIWQRIKINLKN